MNWSQLFTSSIGKKIVMSVTGLFLISFLVVHVSVNACIFKDALDVYRLERQPVTSRMIIASSLAVHEQDDAVWI